LFRARLTFECERSQRPFGGDVRRWHQLLKGAALNAVQIAERVLRIERAA
jgi:hypothetical protein